MSPKTSQEKALWRKTGICDAVCFPFFLALYCPRFGADFVRDGNAFGKGSTRAQRVPVLPMGNAAHFPGGVKKCTSHSHAHTTHTHTRALQYAHKHPVGDGQSAKHTLSHFITTMTAAALLLCCCWSAFNPSSRARAPVCAFPFPSVPCGSLSLYPKLHPFEGRITQHVPTHHPKRRRSSCTRADVRGCPLEDARSGLLRS